MTAINHALTGATLGLLIGNPWLAVPAALLSHFICDALPHYGSATEDEVFLKSKQFKVSLISDAALCVALVAVLTVARPQHWFLAVICAFIAASPDLLWIGMFRRAQGNKPLRSSNYFLKFAEDIQWFQRPIGGVVEAAWFIGGGLIISMFIR